MIDNFELIRSMFYFNEANYMFFHLQIVQRAKDHKGENMKVRESIIKTYFIRSKEHLDRVKEEVVLLCEHYGARAYINVAGKDFSALQSLMLVKLANDVHQGIVRNPRKCLNSAAGELKSRVPKWIVDVDDVSIRGLIKSRLFELYAEDETKADSNISIEALRKAEYSYIYAEVPTKNGIHLIVKPFNIKAFRESFPDVDIHKNSMGTVLYIPRSIDHRYVCSVCSCPNIQIQAWVNANTNEYMGNIAHSNDCWCENCKAHTKIREI